MKIISYTKSADPTKGIVIYAKVQSRTRKAVQHTVTASRRGKSLTWRCTCEDKIFNPRVKCAHIQKVEDRS
jgi:hypothetical protein